MLGGPADHLPAPCADAALIKPCRVRQAISTINAMRQDISHASISRSIAC
jgi:hypothetical protein